jgi:hypothetical protein
MPHPGGKGNASQSSSSTSAAAEASSSSATGLLQRTYVAALCSPCRLLFAHVAKHLRAHPGAHLDWQESTNTFAVCSLATGLAHSLALPRFSRRSTMPLPSRTAPKLEDFVLKAADQAAPPRRPSTADAIFIPAPSSARAYVHAMPRGELDDQAIVLCEVFMFCSFAVPPSTRA